MKRVRSSWVAVTAMFALLGGGCIDATTVFTVPDPGDNTNSADSSADDSSSEDAGAPSFDATAGGDDGG